MQVGFSNVILVPDVDFTVPSQVSQERKTDVVASSGLNYAHRHYLSESGYLELDESTLPTAQEDLYASLFSGTPGQEGHIQNQVNAAKAQLRKVVGDSTAGAKIDERHGLLTLAATKAKVVRNKREFIEKSGSWVKYLAPKALGLFMLAESSGAFSMRVGTIPRHGSPDDFSGLDLGFTTTPFQNLPFAFCVSWLGGELLKKAHDWLQPTYATGLDRTFKEISNLAEDFRKVGLDGANARMGGEPAANLVRTYGEHGRDFLESLMNEVDHSAYNYLLALKRVGPSMSTDQFFSTTGVSSAALQLTSARLEESRFIRTFTGRTQAGQAIVKDWTPSAAFSALGQKKRVAFDPSGSSRYLLNRSRPDFSEPAGASQVWDYSRKLDEAMVYVESKAKDVFSLDKSPEAQKMWKEIKEDFKAMHELDAKAMFRIGVQLEKGVLGIPAGIEAVNLAKQFYLPSASKGEPEAQFRLGQLYAKSHGFGLQGQKDEKIAIEWLTKAADQDHAEAAGQVGVLLVRGNSGLALKQVQSLAREYCEKAVRAGIRHPELLFTLARLLKDSGHSSKLSESYLVEAAEAGHPEARRDAGLLRLSQEKVELAVDYLQTPALRGDSVALYYMGELYLNQQAKAPSGRQNHDMAAECFQKAADLGHIDAHFKLGLMLFNGVTGSRAGEPDYERAAFHFETAAKTNHAQAKCHLAEVYLERLVSPHKGKSSVQTAMELYEEAVALGSQVARLSLCKLLSENDILPAPERNKKLVKLLSQASRADNADHRIFYKLGMMYVDRLEGLATGDTADQLAVQYLEQTDMPEAKFQLAQLYLNGRAKASSREEMQEVVAELLTPLAEAGNAEAKFQLAVLFLNADIEDETTLEQNERVNMAAQLLTQASGLGHAKAKARLAWAKLESSQKEGTLGEEATQTQIVDLLSSVPEHEKANAYSAFLLRMFDARLALKIDLKSWPDCLPVLKAAAEAKHTPSLRVLAVLYLRGVMQVESSKADALAVGYLQQATALNDPEAMLLLGMMYEKQKIGVSSPKKGLKEAFALYRKAAKMGLRHAMFRQGVMIERGAVPVQNGKNHLEKAAALYLKAAKKGDVDAMYALGCLHQQGHGALSDGETHEDMAGHWFVAAADLGLRVAKDHLDVLRKYKSVAA